MQTFKTSVFRKGEKDSIENLGDSLFGGFLGGNSPKMVSHGRPFSKMDTLRYIKSWFIKESGKFEEKSVLKFLKITRCS